MDAATHGKEVLVVGEDVCVGEDDHLIAAVVAAPVQQTGIEEVDEAHDNGAVGHPLQEVHGVCYRVTVVVACVEEGARRLPLAPPPEEGPNGKARVFVYSERVERLLDGGR